MTYLEELPMIRRTSTALTFAALIGATVTGISAPADATPAAPRMPAAYRDVVATAPLRLCGHEQVTAALIERQLRGASNFDQRAVSASGAQGPAQLTPAMFAVYGADDAGTGQPSPFNITDAVSALVRLDCTLTTQLQTIGHTIDPVDILAAYTGGIGSVDSPYVREQAIGIWSPPPADH